MGFNNGYDSGYADCETENRKKWEAEAVKRFRKSIGMPDGAAGVNSQTHMAMSEPVMYAPNSQVHITDGVVVQTEVGFDDETFLPTYEDTTVNTGFYVQSVWSQAKIVGIDPSTMPKVTVAGSYDHNAAKIELTVTPPIGGFHIYDSLILTLSPDFDPAINYAEAFEVYINGNKVNDLPYGAMTSADSGNGAVVGKFTFDGSKFNSSSDGWMYAAIY